jgi:mannose-6-phosphate isomerase-like protein (cupin superfamily)
MLHHRELFFYVVSGTFEVTVTGAAPETVSRGDVILVRDGADRIVNVGRRPGRMLVVGVAGAGH